MGDNFKSIRDVFRHKPPPSEYSTKKCGVPSCPKINNDINKSGYCKKHEKWMK